MSTPKNVAVEWRRALYQRDDIPLARLKVLCALSEYANWSTGEDAGPAGRTSLRTPASARPRSTVR